MERDFVTRRAGRFIPATAVTVALIDQNLPVAYGVVRNLSEIGASIMTDRQLRLGSRYEFRMSFFGGRVLEAEARIVWNEEDSRAPDDQRAVPHGLEFTQMKELHLETLRVILASADFGSAEASRDEIN